MTFLKRYLDGESEAVWAELVAMKGGVRRDPIYADAKAVADETMRRARSNVETIISRLEQLGYQFSIQPPKTPQSVEVSPATALRLDRTLEYVTRLGLDEYQADPYRHPAFDWARAAGIPLPINTLSLPDPGGVARNEPGWVSTSATAKGRYPPLTPYPAAELDAFESRHGLLPISLRAWYETVGPVDFCGSHPVLMDPASLYSPDPLVIDPIDSAEEILGMFGDDEDSDDDGSGRSFLALAPDDLHKVNVSGGDPYGMYVPDENADAEFVNYARGATFVDYLRDVIRWGGFPGWKLSGNKAPRKELDILTKDLLPI